MRLVLAENPLREVEMEAPFLRLGDGEEGGTDEVFCERRQDRGYARILGVHVPVEDVNLKIVEVLTGDSEIEHRTILYKYLIARAEIKLIVCRRLVRRAVM